jgi:hypothetical protein
MVGLVGFSGTNPISGTPDDRSTGGRVSAHPDTHPTPSQVTARRTNPGTTPATRPSEGDRQTQGTPSPAARRRLRGCGTPRAEVARLNSPTRGRRAPRTERRTPTRRPTCAARTTSADGNRPNAPKDTKPRAEGGGRRPLRRRLGTAGPRERKAAPEGCRPDADRPSGALRSEGGT